MNKLLARKEFRESVFKRDGYKCVVCGEKATYDKNGEVDNLDAHHIIEKRLWISKNEEGGYFTNNGVSLCDKNGTGCHSKAEQTLISCDELRAFAKIDKAILPENLYRDENYDKWGNLIMKNGRRTKGPLFYDESVQKILRPVIHLFDDYVKYSRTYHLPFSPGTTKDDKVLSDCSQFENKRVIATLKLDGENSNLYNDYYHARSLTIDAHPSRDWIKNFHSRIRNDIPKGWRLCGENLFAQHSIKYTNLKSYFYLFSIWNERNECLSWDETKEYADLLNVELVPVLYDGIWNEKKIKALYQKEYNGNDMEGFVVRIADSFSYGQFSKCVAKYVRENHVDVNRHHWKYQKIEQNLLK
jgi:hypothetical protein